MKACIPGGVFEQEVHNEHGTVASAKGQLPCPFFHLLGTEFASRKVRRRLSRTITPVPPQLVPDPEPQPESQSAGTNGTVASTLPAMDCRCGAVPMSEIEAVLLDPRNSSFQYWRHRQPDVILKSYENTDIALKPVQPVEAETDLPPGWTVELDQLSNRQIYVNFSTGEIQLERPSLNQGWSREEELLGRGFTPANVHETARLRLGLAEKSAEAAARLVLEATRKKGMSAKEIALAEVKVQVIQALDRGRSVLCPRCGTQVEKDENCIHIDSCPCGAKWCFLCGKDQTGCPRGRGCDVVSLYLERQPGWEAFDLTGEDNKQGAQMEFFRRRQAFMVRAVMEQTPPDLWAAFRENNPTMLAGTPTPGRSIDWDSLEDAEEPLFGARLREAERENAADPGAAKRRFQQYWANVRLEQEAVALREARQWRHRVCCFPTVAILIALLAVGTDVLFRYYPPPSPVYPVFYNESADGGLGRATELVEPGNVASNLTLSRAFESMDFNEATFPEQFLKLMPIVLLVLGWAPICVAWFFQLLGKNIFPREYTAAMTGLSLIAMPFFWHISAQGEEIEDILASSWFVAYMWRPFSVFTNGIWVMAVIFATWGSLIDDHVWRRGTVLKGCACVPSLMLAVCSIICTALIRRSDDDIDAPCGTEGGDCVVVDTAVFVCTWGCGFVAWYPRIVFLVGVALLCIVLLIWLRKREDIHVPVQALMALIFAGALFWPATMESDVLLGFSWFASYVLSPICTCVLGSGWLLTVCIVAFEATRYQPSSEAKEEMLLLCGCLSFASFVLWEVGMATFRASNGEYTPVPTAGVPDSYQWSGAAYWLSWAPTSLLSFGALEGCVLVGHAMVKGTQTHRVLPITLAAITVGFILSFWPLFVLDVDSYVTIHWTLGYYALPACQGFLAAAWFAMTTAMCCEQVLHQWVHDTWRDVRRDTQLLVGFFCAVSVISYCSAMIVWRSSATEVAPNLLPTTFTYEYECTWPCVALRIFLSCGLGLMGAAGVMSVRAMHRDRTTLARTRRCAPLCFSLLISLGLFALAVSEAVFEWPVEEVPLELLIRGAALINYCWVPVLSMVLFYAGCRVLTNLMSARCKLLSEMYDASSIVVAASGTGSAWLVYVLRRSADPTFREWEFSQRSRIIFWELMGVLYWGLVLVAYYWKTRLLQQPLWTPKDSCRLVGRTLLFWVPCTAWPLMLLAARGKEHDILNEVFAKCPLAFVGLAVGVSGFFHEVTRACGWQRRARLPMAVAAGCVVLVTNAWLLLGERCLSLWWRGLREHLWFLLQDTCEAL